MNTIYRLLVVDDDDLNLGLFSLFLTQLGHEVTAVNNPFDAIKHALENDFDLIVSDIQMPGMTGIEASKIIRNNGFSGPIIALTAHLTLEEETNIIRAGLNDVLIKPVTKKDLIQLLKQWLGDEPAVSENPIKYRHESTASADGNHSLFDKQIALKRADNRPDLALELFELFFKGLGSDYQQLLQIIENRDIEALKTVIHKTNGGIRFCGFPAMEKIIDTCESKIKPLDSWDGESFQEDIDTLLEEIVTLINWQCENPNPFKD